jgi:hypothetical protein
MIENATRNPSDGLQARILRCIRESYKLTFGDLYLRQPEGERGLGGLGGCSTAIDVGGSRWCVGDGFAVHYFLTDEGKKRVKVQGRDER